jgi:hypothetical protein
MQVTEYSSLTTDELVQFASLREGATSLEVELAQRLTLALDLINELQEEAAVEPTQTEDQPHGSYT